MIRSREDGRRWPADNLIVVLVRPEEAGNIGAAARAMNNMGLRRLHLVSPCRWDTEEARKMAHRSLDVLRGAKVFGDLDSAVSTASELIGFSARRRRKGPLPLPIEQIAPEILARASGQPVALLFGPESTGLSNEEFARCHRVVSISTGPDFPSLNLAQAVLAAAYTLRLCVTKRKAASPPPIAPADEMESLFRQLKEVLVRIEFLKGAQAPVLFRDLRQILLRARPDSREVRILRGILRQVVWASGGSKNRL